MSDEQIIAALKRRGLDNQEARDLLRKWTRQNEEEADKINTAAANAECALKQARLYHQAGFSAEALRELEISRLEAINRGDEIMRRRILDIMDKIEEEIK